MCNFSIQFSSDAADVVNKAKEAITAAGGNFTGDTTNGNFGISTFMGAISGDYLIQQNSIQINISKKPAFVPCSEIEKQLRKYLS